MRVNTRDIISTRRTSTERNSPQWHIYTPVWQDYDGQTWLFRVRLTRLWWSDPAIQGTIDKTMMVRPGYSGYDWQDYDGQTRLFWVRLTRLWWSDLAILGTTDKTMMVTPGYSGYDLNSEASAVLCQLSFFGIAIVGQKTPYLQCASFLLLFELENPLILQGL